MSTSDKARQDRDAKRARDNALAQQTPNISNWSRHVPSHGMTLADIDLYLLKDHPEVLRALGRERYPNDKIKDLRTRDWVITLLFCFILPFAGITTFTGGYDQSRSQQVDPLSDDLAVPISSVCFLIALFGVGWAALRWWRTQRHWSGAELLALGAAVLCGGGVLWQMHGAGIAVLDPALVSVPVWLTTGLSALLLLLMAVASRGQRAVLARHFKVVGEPDVQEAMKVISGMTPSRVEELLGKRERAIARLHERGVIDEDERRSLEELPMGLSPTLR